MAKCITIIKIIGTDIEDYTHWKAHLQSAIDCHGFIVVEDDPDSFVFSIQHEDNI